MRRAPAAQRSLLKLVRHVGWPGAGDERAPIVAALAELLADERCVAVRRVAVHREALWMLSELADGGAPIERAAALLAHEVLRADARMEMTGGDLAAHHTMRRTRQVSSYAASRSRSIASVSVSQTGRSGNGSPSCSG